MSPLLRLLSVSPDNFVRGSVVSGRSSLTALATGAQWSNDGGDTTGTTGGGATENPLLADGGSTVGGYPDELLAHISDGFLSVDSEWIVTDANETAAAMLDQRRETLVGNRLWDIWPEDVGAPFDEEVRTVMETSTETTFEVSSEPLDLWIAVTVYPTDDGVSLLFEDITERTQIRKELQESDAAIERLHEIASNPELSRDEKIDKMLQVGRDLFGTTYGFLTRIEGDTQEIIRSVGTHPELQPGATAPLSEAYCRHTLGSEQPLAVTDATAEGRVDDPAYDRFGLGCYLGATIYIDGDQYGTVCFADTEPRQSAFTEHEQTFLELLTDLIQQLLEQRAYEAELKQQQAFTESIMDSLPDPLYVFNEDGELLRWNERLEAVTGYDADEIRELTALEFIAEDDRDRITEIMSGVWDGERRSVEAALETRDGDQIPYEFSSAPLRDESGSIIGVTGVGRDITERREHEQRLSGLLELTRSLMQARDREHVGEIVTNAAAEVLDFDINVFRLYNSDAGTLEPTAVTESVRESMGDRPVYEVGEGYPGEVFASGEPVVRRNIEDGTLGTVRSVMYYPVGVHGTISVGSTEPDAFDETDEQVLALLATSAAAACMRAKREREVREAREHTERVLERINGLVEDTVEVLVQATTRKELEKGVVRELAAAEPYSFAWIGRPDVASETLSPSAWDGDASVSISGHSFDLSRGGEPVSDAYREELPQVASLDGEMGGPWADIVADSDVGGLVAVPLVYKDVNYGVLVVFADDIAVFDERERVVLDALGQAIANAINAIERGRILDATEIIELEFAIDDRDLLFSRLSAGANCTIESAGTDYRSDGSLRLYVTATGVDADELVELARTDGAVEEVTCIVEHEDECLLEVIVEESLLETLTEYGAVPREVVAEGGQVQFTVELPYEAEARDLFEIVEAQYPGTDLLGYHERERPVETRQEFKSALGERFTDRQETALRTAFLGGFFDWPRDIDGNELAEAMDISRPTYHQHLRAAQRKVLEELFE